MAAALPRRDQLRRVAILSTSFMRNLAFYRAGQNDRFRSLLEPSHPHAAFWRQANANFIDVAVLDWCKLMADKNDQHCWRNVVADPTSFEADMLAHLGLSVDGFADYAAEVRHYRDKFIAHLDADKVMQIPKLEAAYDAVAFYYRHVTKAEATGNELAGLCDTAKKLEQGFQQSISEAEGVFSLEPAGISDDG